MGSLWIITEGTLGSSIEKTRQEDEKNNLEKVLENDALNHPNQFMMASGNDGPCVRVIMQQCLSARLQVQPPTDQQQAEYVEIKRGIILYITFLKGATMDIVPKVVKSVLNVRLSENHSNSKVSILELPGDVLIVPQATIGGKLKGKSMQYHTNIPKAEAMELYKEFVSSCKKTVSEEAKITDCDVGPRVKWGTYGNRQVLSSSTNGPFTHVLDF